MTAPALTSLRKVGLKGTRTRGSLVEGVNEQDRDPVERDQREHEPEEAAASGGAGSFRGCSGMPRPSGPGAPASHPCPRAEPWMGARGRLRSAGWRGPFGRSTPAWSCRAGLLGHVPMLRAPCRSGGIQGVTRPPVASG